jgi:hypothetical protein
MKLNVTTHSGLDDVVEVESYKPLEIAEQLNNHEIMAIVIGDNVYSRIDVKNIRPFEQNLEK